MAALDHSERVVAELARKDGESAAQKTARAQAWIANRVPDVHFLMNYILSATPDSKAKVDPTQIGIVGHSFGGWTALAAHDGVQGHPSRGRTRASRCFPEETRNPSR